jgi:hypothetical protein
MTKNRDEFPQHTKNALALRAGHICSFENCGQSTAGPSYEAADAVTMIGVAAHICAAAPGGRRYDPAMTPAERSHISNGIWLCQKCSVIIDRDEVTFTADGLRNMKLKHEASRSFNPRPDGAADADDIIAIGDGIIGVGEFTGVDATGWKARIKHFVLGDALELVSYASNFENVESDGRYVLMNALGDGRVLSGAPAITRNGSAFDVVFPIHASFARTQAQRVGSSMALSSETDDLFIENGKIARVSGLAALPQNLQTSLGLAMGESPFHSRWGTRISLFYRDFGKSVWLNRLIKMEIIRLASIPQDNRMNNSTHTPLLCVDRVRDVEVLAEGPANQRLPVRIVLDVNGVGRWQHDISIFIHTDEQLGKVAQRIPSWLAEARR